MNIKKMVIFIISFMTLYISWGKYKTYREYKKERAKNDIVEINKTTAFTICNSLAKQSSKYGYKMSFDYIAKSKGNNWNIYIRNAKIKNTFGTYGKVNIYCEVVKKGKRILVDTYSSTLVTDYNIK